LLFADIFLTLHPWHGGVTQPHRHHGDGHVATSWNINVKGVIRYHPAYEIDQKFQLLRVVGNSVHVRDYYNP